MTGMVPQKVHEHGYVTLLDVMGSDQDIVDAARISYDRQGDTKDRALIRYLMRHRHTSPFEMAELKFELKMPIFVARQWVRHRTASMNEVSARYTQLPNEMFVPEALEVQSTGNKQGRNNRAVQDEAHALTKINGTNMYAYGVYEDLLDADASRELARGVLPLNTYTKFVWKMDLHNLMHFLNLRLDPHAQKEIRDYAEVIEKIVESRFPITYEAFVHYVRDSYTLSSMETTVIQELLYQYKDLNDGVMRVDEFCKRLGMSQREIDKFKEVFIDG